LNGYNSGFHPHPQILEPQTTCESMRITLLKKISCVQVLGLQMKSKILSNEIKATEEYFPLVLTGSLRSFNLKLTKNSYA